jgi:hypothetical protein
VLYCSYLHRRLSLSLAYLHLHSIVAPCILKFMALKARKGKKMTETENFKRARDNETDDRYLGTGWVRFHHFDVVEKTEDNVRVEARKHDPLRMARRGRATRASGYSWTITQGMYTPRSETSPTCS